MNNGGPLLNPTPKGVGAKEKIPIICI